jgi:hypothetical protein
MPKKRVFVDTNAILPCVSAGEWKRLCGHYAVETVSTVVDETQRGDITRRKYVVVDKAMLLTTLTSVHDTTHKDRADFLGRLKTLEPSARQRLLARVATRSRDGTAGRGVPSLVGSRNRTRAKAIV